MQQQIQVMLDLQESMNLKVHAQWRQQGLEWYRAIWVECAELMDHYGWKWWKKQTPDMEQVQLELIDIWHFGLSLLLIKGVPASRIANELQVAIEQPAPTDVTFHQLLEDFTGDTLLNQDFSIAKFAPLLPAAQMSFSTLYTGYVGKNVLNVFRQDHGYQEGRYQKIWDGIEDNRHLADIVKTLDTSATAFKEQLYQALSVRYQQLCD